ncbi:MAG TPA: glycosyltransferase [Terriglobia bacterium]|nr:glycosyltransferase [Terriglobia bacterium]
MTRGSFTAAERRQNEAPGVSPEDSSIVSDEAPEGRQSVSNLSPLRGFGLRCDANPGLTPEATLCRRSAAAKDPLVILSLSFGMGDITAARAVAEAWRENTGCDAIIIDAIEWFPLWFKALYVMPYWLMIRYCPALWRRLFEARLRNLHRHTISPVLLALGARRLLEMVSRLHPPAILAAEVGACEIASLYKRRMDASVRILPMILNYESEPAWVQPGIDVYLVSSDRVAAELREWGAGRTPIEVVGIPVRKDFRKAESKAAARARCGLSPERPIVLLMAGGMGPARLDAAIKELDRRTSIPIQAVAIAGRDRALLPRLRKLRPARLELCALGWTEDVSSYMAAADVLITKPGALTLREALAMNLPTIAFDPLPGLEEENAREWVRRGAGWLSRNPAEAAAMADAVLRGALQLSSTAPADSETEMIVRLLQVNCV